MATFSKVFQDEVRRLARKEVKDTLAKLQSESAGLRRTVSDMKQRVAALERDNRRLVKDYGERREEAMQVTPTAVDRARISGKTIRTLRDKLGLTQADFARLLDVSPQSVYQWERRDDRLQLRGGTKQAIVEAKTLGAREARKLLEAM